MIIIIVQGRRKSRALEKNDAGIKIGLAGVFSCR